MCIADWSVACFTTYSKYGGRVSPQRGQEYSGPGSRPHLRVLLHLGMCCDSYLPFFFFLRLKSTYVAARFRFSLSLPRIRSRRHGNFVNRRYHLHAKKSALVEIPGQILNLGLIRRKSDRSVLQPQSFRIENCIDFKALSVFSNTIIARNNDSVLHRYNTITFHLSLVFCVLIA